MKLKKSDANLLLMAIGIAVALLAYFLVFQKLNTMTDELNSSNAKLQTEVDYLQDLADHKQQYLDDTAAMQASIDEIKAQFPAQYQSEDDILYIVGIEKNYDSEVSSIGMGNAEVIQVAQTQAASTDTSSDDEDDIDGEESTDTASTDTASTQTQSAAASSISLYRTPVSVAMTTSYQSIKDVIEKINTDQDRKSIETLSLAFDSETGDLSANVSMSLYSLTGTEATYTTPTVDGVVFGTSNIFNSADKKAAIEAEKKATEEAEDSEESEE
jgi:low affinity Fe/Cu permease